MGERTLRVFLIVGAGLVALTALGSLWWHPAAALGILAGGAWNLANLWCLGRALTVWLGPQPSPPAPLAARLPVPFGTGRQTGRAGRRRAAWWFIVKFPVLYGLAVALLMAPGISLAGFGLGFSVVLAMAVVAGIAWSQRALPSLPSHGG